MTKKNTTIIGVAVMAAIIVSTAAGCGCDTEKSETRSDVAAATAIEEVTQIVTDEQGATHIELATEIVTVPAEIAETTPTKSGGNQSHAADEEKEESSGAESEKTSGSSSNKNQSSNFGKASSNTGSGKSSSSSTSGSASSKSSGSSSSKASQSSSGGSSSKSSGSSSSNFGSSSKASSDPNSGKTWHEAVYKTVNHPAETKQFKVVDREAYSYEEPIYEWRTFCNVCGADITYDCYEHMSAHMLADEGGRYHDDYVQVGSQTVNVPEQSHMETIVVKEAWTEKVLVKEAGWY